jgi:hypothetical protein
VEDRLRRAEEYFFILDLVDGKHETEAGVVEARFGSEPVVELLVGDKAKAPLKTFAKTSFRKPPPPIFQKRVLPGTRPLK